MRSKSHSLPFHLRFLEENLTRPFLLIPKNYLCLSYTSHILLFANRAHQLTLFHGTANIVDAPNLHLGLSFDCPSSHVRDEHYMGIGDLSGLESAMFNQVKSPRPAEHLGGGAEEPIQKLSRLPNIIRKAPGSPYQTSVDFWLLLEDVQTT